MQILTVLSAVGKVESSVGELYHWFSELFAGDVEASGFFFRMSMQERSHANLVSFCKKLVHRTPSAFTQVDVDLNQVHDLLESIKKFREENPKPSLGEALSFAIRVERHGAEQIHRSMIIQSNPEVASVINSLAKADQEHSKLLEQFAAKRGQSG